jgi:hypothetical protein
MMDSAEFKLSLSQRAPPNGLGAALDGLWWAAKGDWARAHKIVQDEQSKDAAWVHAYLHRVEGDLGNARYWYRQAGRSAHSGALEQEWSEIVATLLTPAGNR